VAIGDRIVAPGNSRAPLGHDAGMAEVRFLPFYVDTIEHVLSQASRKGEVDVELRAGIDPDVVASQIVTYARSTGVQVKCRRDGDRVR
jgi:hypothetical protein